MRRIPFARRLSRPNALWSATAWLFASLVLPAVAQSQTPVNAGYRDFDYGTTVNSTPTGEKPESKLWFNDGSWWGVLWGGPSATAYTIHKFNVGTQAWTSTGVAVDDRSSTKGDALWDGTKLYVASSVWSGVSGPNGTNGSRLYRYSYNASTDTYTLDSGFPVTINSSKCETIVLAKDGTGQLWITWVESGKVKVNRSLGDDLTWGTPFDLPVQGSDVHSENDDISSIITLPGPPGKIGIMWTNQEDDTDYFATHLDSDGDLTWQPREIALAPEGAYTTPADDHISLGMAADGSGNLFAVTKTSLTTSHGLDAPLVYLLRRTAAGVWTKYVYGTVQEDHTRPILQLDNLGNIYVFAHRMSAGSREVVYMKQTTTAALSFPPGAGTPFIDSSLDNTVRNPTGTKQALTSTSGLLIAASDQNTHHYLHNYLPISGGSGPSIASFSPASGMVSTQVTLQGSGFTGATQVTFNGVPAPGFIVDSNTQIRVNVPSGANDGPISVTSGGTAFSSTNFVVVYIPTIASFTPGSGPPGTAVTVNGTEFAAATSVTFNNIPAIFTINNDAQLVATVPSGATTGRVRVVNAAGTVTSTTDFTVTAPPPEVTFNTIHDARVQSDAPTSNYGTGTVLRVRSETATPVYRTYLKFDVSGLSGSVTNAKIRMFCNDDSPDGGRVYSVSNNYNGTSTPWVESGLTWNTAPALAGSPLDQKGAVALNTWVEFNVTSAITGNGTYSFGLNNNSTNIAGYDSKEAANDPQLVITTGSTTPTITSFTPSSGLVGTQITITGTSFTGATAVDINGVNAPGFIVDNSTQIRVNVPTGATTGPIHVSTPSGTATSAGSFTVTHTLATSVVGTGAISKVPDQPTYNQGTNVQITAVPAVGWSFVSWGGDASGSTSPTNVLMNGNKSVTATFAINTYTLGINTVGSGSVAKVPDQPTYTHGTNVQLTATPVAGWTFAGWSGSATGTLNPLTITMDANKSITATFTINSYTLNVTPSGSGSVAKLPDQPTYTHGTNVQLTATPAVGWSFVSWSGGASGSTNPLTVLMDANKTITATFAINTYTLNVTPSGSGSVAKLPDQPTYTHGTNVQLTATPAVGWSFVSWSGGASGSTNPLTVLMDANKSITATFAINTYTLSFATVGSGSVAKLPDQPTYNHGSIVQLTATPSATWNFVGWSGDATGSTNPVSVTMNANKSVTATFALNMYALDVSIVGSGTVARLPNQASYSHGTNVQLTANPSTGWHFVDWTDDATGTTNPTNLVMDGPKSVTATFAINTYTLVVPIVGSGSVSKSPDLALYDHGAAVDLTPNPAVGWSFVGWSGDASGNANPLNLTMNGNKSVTATFAINSYTLTLSQVGSGTVSKNPDQPTYTHGSGVQVTAGADLFWTFTGWSGDASGSDNPLNVVMNGNKTVTATFVIDTYALSVPIIGTGTVARVPDLTAYAHGSSVELTANPGTGWHFVSWSGDASGSTNPVNVLMNGPKSVTATFAINTYTLDVTTTGSGSVAKFPNQSTYDHGANVELTATPSPTWNFIGWSGDASSFANPLNLTMDANKSVTATFAINMYTLAVSATGAGSVLKSPDQAAYSHGTSVDLTAVPEAGWTFVDWGGDLSAHRGVQNVTFASNPLTIVMDSNKSITATFQVNTYALNVLTSGSGSVAKSPDQTLYDHGSSVDLTATPGVGFTFIGWSDDATGTTNPVNVLMDGEKTVTATFAPNIYALDVTITGSGSVSKNPDQSSYADGATVQLTATAAANWHFVSWTGGATGSTNPINVVMNGNKSVGATFAIDTYAIAITTAGSGSVAKNPDLAAYDHGSSVELTANPGSGWHFVEWSGNATGTTNPVNVVMDGTKSVTATFAINTYALGVTIIGSGSVTQDPDQATYDHGTSVDLTATASVGWSFTGWSGDVTGTTNPATVVMDGAKSVTATFTINSYALSISTVGSGSVAKLPDQLTYDHGTIVGLTATPTATWNFVGWSGDATGSTNPVNVVMDGAKSVTATFALNTYVLGITIVGSGTVAKDPDQATYAHGSSVDLAATETPGWHFVNWSGDATGDTNPVNVVMDGPKSVTATFAIDTHALAISTVGSGSVAKNPDQANYDHGTSVDLTANPVVGWHFVSWSGDATGNTNPTSVLMNGPKSVTATFAINSYTLNVAIVGSGAVAKNPNQATYTHGANVQLTATPSPGSSFTGWSGDATGAANPLSVLMDGNKSITATFASAPSQLTFVPVHDARVVSSTPTTNYGTATVLRVRSVNPTNNSYLKFNVSGLAGSVQSATLRLFCNDSSVDGGKVYTVSNNYLGTSTAWVESGINWNNAPAISGSPLATKGSVPTNTWVEFDVTAAIAGNGTYSFGMTSGSTNIAGYSSKEGAQDPELVIVASSLPVPLVSSFLPTSGPVGTEVTITGDRFTGTTAVGFNGVAATSFVVDSDTQVRATVPTGASTGPITVANGVGSGNSSSNFVVLGPPSIASFTPGSGPAGTEVTITGNGFTGATAVDFNGLAATFQVDLNTQIRATVPNGATSGPIHVITPLGTATSASNFTVTAPQPELTFTPLHDTRVQSDRPTTAYGTVTLLRVRSETATPVYRTYLKFDVTGVGGAVTSAKLRLFCNDDSPDGGKVYSVSNNYSATSTPWVESGLTWSNAPALSGSPLDQKGAVALNSWVEFDVTSAITGNGTFSFGLNSNSTNIAGYSSKEGANDPQLVLMISADPMMAIASFTPDKGLDGTELEISGSGFDQVTMVTIAGLAADFTIEDNTLIRVTAPDRVITGPISLASEIGNANSPAPFTVNVGTTDVALDVAPLSLGLAYPNPFRSTTRLRFALPSPEPVRLVVFDVQGRRVRTLADGTFEAGSHDVSWDARDEAGARVEPGIYLIQLEAAGVSTRRKVALIR